MIGGLGRFAWRLLGGASHRRDWRALAGVDRAGVDDPRDSVRPALEPPADFEACVRAYGLDDGDLGRLHRRHAWRFYCFAGGGLFAASFGAAAALERSGQLGVLACLMALLFWAVATRHGLRAWQIRERRLGAYREWLRRPGAWFPPLFPTRTS